MKYELRTKCSNLLIVILLVTSVLTIATPLKIIESPLTPEPSQQLPKEDTDSSWLPGEFFVSMGAELTTLCPASNVTRAYNPEAEAAVSTRIKEALAPFLAQLSSQSAISVENEVFCMSRFVLLRFVEQQTQTPIDIDEKDISRAIAQLASSGLFTAMRTQEKLNEDYWSIVRRVEGLEDPKQNQTGNDFENSTQTFTNGANAQHSEQFSEDWSQGAPTDALWVMRNRSAKSADWNPNDPLNSQNKDFNRTSGMKQVYNWCDREALEISSSKDPDYQRYPVVVAVIDSGIHPEVGRRYIDSGWTKERYCTHPKNPSCVLTTKFPGHILPESHGTMVASAILSVANDNKGIAGIAPVELFDINDQDPDGNADTASALRALEVASEFEADSNTNLAAINMSQIVFELTKNMEANPLCQALTPESGHTIWREAPLIVSAGNDGANLDKLKPNEIGLAPQMCNRSRNVIKVAAMSSVYRDSPLAPYSNYGAHFVDIAAPIPQAVEAIDTKDPSRLNPNGGLYPQGTSFAAPVVTGMYAFAYWLWFVGNHTNPEPTCAPSMKIETGNDDRYTSSPWAGNHRDIRNLIDSGIIAPQLSSTKISSAMLGAGPTYYSEYDPTNFKVNGAKVANLCAWATGCGRYYNLYERQANEISNAPDLTECRVRMPVGSSQIYRACTPDELSGWATIRNCENVCIDGISLSSSSSSSNHSTSSSSSSSSTVSSQNSSSVSSKGSMSVVPLPSYEMERETIEEITNAAKEKLKNSIYLCRDQAPRCCKRNSLGEIIHVACPGEASSSSSSATGVGS